MDFREALVNELSKRKLVESRNRKTEDTEEFLEPRFDSRASFYKKAKVVKRDNGDEELYSYDTHVGGVKDGKPYSKGKWSQTTTRHQKEYFQQKGYDPKDVEVVENKKVEGKRLQEGMSIDSAADFSEALDTMIDVAKTELQELKSNYADKASIGESTLNDLIKSLQTSKSLSDKYINAIPKIMGESKKVESNGEVPQSSYDIAEYIKEKSINKNRLDMEEFNQLLDDAKSKILNGNENNEDLDAEVRGILSYYGWDTDYESGDIFKAEESKKVTEGIEDNISKAYDYLEDINMGAADLLMKVADYFGQDQANDFATNLVSSMQEGKGCKNCKKGGK